VAPTLKNMISIPAGTFLMGSEQFYPEEMPVREVRVEAFQLDEHPVTNAEFGRFVRATNYVTVAERVPVAEDFETTDDLAAGSLVFRATDGPVPLDDWRRWWRWTPGAFHREPQGPGSDIVGFQQHPVVHVAYEDAQAYAEWAGKRLVSEAEWEYAAQCGQADTTYAWGEEFMPNGRSMANTWHGRFPFENLSGHVGTTPIGRYRANNWGLLDMIGNVWEWTSTSWTPDHAAPEHSCCAPTAPGPTGEDERRTMKGGSHLCAPSYCLRYRPAARQGQTVRSSTSHLGFRCAAD
jgi:sulfatase modifying factor 1